MLHRRRKLSNASGSPAALELTEWSQRSAPETAGARRSSKRRMAPAWRRWADAAERIEQRVRASLTRRFAHHGRWISRHQTRTLLLCNLVIASLFYPAVVMYLLTTSESAALGPSSHTCVERHRVLAEQPAACVGGALAPTNIWDVALVSLSDILGGGRVQRSDTSYAVHDLRLLWDETPSLEVVPYPEDRADAPTVHMAQVLVTAKAVQQGGGSPYGMLEPHALLAAQRMQDALERRLALSEISCVESDGQCLVLSPLDYWHRSAEAVHADWHPAKSYSGSPVRAVVTPPVAPLVANSTMPLLYSTTLASRWPYLPLFSRAEYLVLTFFLHDSPDIWTHWRAIVEATAAETDQATLSVPTHVGPGETFLRSLTARPTLNISVVAGGYMILLSFIFRGLVQMRRLHSRFGIAFTGSVQLVLDLIMSLSVCALLGIRLTAVPWSILPFIIVVVGSESMLFMIRTITNTPVSLTMHARIAYGLSQVAGPITLTALSDIVLLILLASTIRVPAVLQFCLFTICTLVVDYFMQMTFFLTVLSIDMQRLELAEVLLQGASAASAPQTQMVDAQPPHEPYRPRSAVGLLMSGGRALWRTRSVRSLRFSIVATVVLTTVFYFAADGTARAYLASLLFAPFGMTADTEKGDVADALQGSAYGALWAAINPEKASIVRMVVEPWALVVLRDKSLSGNGHTPPGPWLEQLFFHRRGATLFLVFLFVVCPIAGTMLIMSVVLRYLRKDADLLETQQDKSDGADAGLQSLLQPGRPRAASEAHGALRVHVEALTDELHPAPLHAICADGTWVASADVCNTLRTAHGPRASLAALAALRTDAGAAPDGSRILTMALAASGDRALLALGQASGRVSVVALPGLQLLMDATESESPLAPVQNVSFRNETLVTFHRDGRLLAWRGIPPIPDEDTSWTRPAAIASAYALAPPLPTSAWTYITVEAAADVCGVVSAKGQLVLFSVAPSKQATDTLAADPLRHVQAPALCRCALVLDAEEDGAAAAATPLTPPRHPQRRTKPWLIAGDQSGVLHLWEVAQTPTASLALAPGDGAVKRLQRVGGTFAHPVLLAATANRVWFVGAHTEGDTPSFVLLGSVENTRGAADLLTVPPRWVLGVRRAPAAPSTAPSDARATPRWEAWRMRVPRFNPVDFSPSQSLPHLERVPFPLEQLIGAGVRQRLADLDAPPPSRLPLLAARIEEMVRVPSEEGTQWYIPFGSCLVTLAAS